ncbi:MAG: ABC transporter permease [Clostridiales bacterium]|nr:ABC transporter permease [Clostridiales bacterium]
MKNTSMQLKTVIRYEFSNFIKNKVFMVITIIIGALLLAGALLPPVFLSGGKEEPGNDPSADRPAIQVFDPTGALSDREILSALLPGYALDFVPGNYGDETADAIQNDELEGALAAADSLHYTFYAKNASMSSAYQEINQALKAYRQQNVLRQAGLSDQQIADAAAVPQVEAAETSGKDIMSTYALTYILIMVLYVSIMLYGQMVAVSVATEKSSRAMELLITSAKPNNLIFGKIIGVGLAGLCQLVIWLAVGAAGISIGKDFWSQIPFVSGVLEAPPYLLALMIVFYLIGYFMYAAMFGALGSLVSRVEDINTTATPIVLLCVAGFVLSFTGMANPFSLLIRICSYVPFFAPMCMFVRVSMSEVPLYEIILSILITGGSSVLFAWLSAKIYRAGTLMYGKPPSLKQLVSVLRRR